MKTYNIEEIMKRYEIWKKQTSCSENHAEFWTSEVKTLLKELKDWAKKQHREYDRNTAPHNCYRQGMDDLNNFIDSL
jgi:hypothetical protein